MQKVIQEYNRIRKEVSLQEAEVYAQQCIKERGLGLAARIAAWKEIKQEMKQEEEISKKVKVDKKKSKNASIKNICTQVLQKLWTITEREKEFLNNIKTKRKLTERQGTWLKDLAKRAQVNIEGDIAIKTPPPWSSSGNKCGHEDLGSLGFVHGSKVICPYCGEPAEVW